MTFNVSRKRRGESLYPREIQIVTLLTKGPTNKEIASKLGITPGTVKIYIGKIYAKLLGPQATGNPRARIGIATEAALKQLDGREVDGAEIFAAIRANL